MSAPKWPVTVLNEHGSSIRVDAVTDESWIYISFSSDQHDVEDGFAMSLTPAQSATLRAALEAAEQEMS